MTGSRIRVYLDEDVSLLVAKLLSAEGYEVKTVSEMNRKGLEDRDQLQFASENGFVILTHNRTDFEDLAVEYFEKGFTHHGIIVAVLRPPQQIASKTLDLIRRFTPTQMTDQIFYV